MRKIPTIFLRKPDNMSEVSNAMNMACSWVFRNEGIATRKYDGTCVAVIRGRYYKRREVGRGKQPPAGFWEVERDATTGKRVGWVPVDPESAEDRWHMEGWRWKLRKIGYLELGMEAVISIGIIPDGTFELCGPKINGNPEGFDEHVLVRHAHARAYSGCPRSYSELRDWLKDKDIEGVVFYDLASRMAKIKKRDFGLRRR